MIIFDTDTLSVAQHPDNPEALVVQRHVLMLSPDEIVCATIVSYEEQIRGWMGFISRATTKESQLKAYFKLLKHLHDWRRANVVPFDKSASDMLDHLRTLKLRIGTFDLKIAAIALTRNAILVTRNTQHFRKIPGLRVEDWTRP